MLWGDMTVNVLKEMMNQGIKPVMRVEEVIPSKGKPAQKAPGSTTVFIIKVSIDGNESDLESSRGGPREWSDLNKLVKWLKSMGIHDYNGSLSNAEELVQQTLALSNNGK